MNCRLCFEEMETIQYEIDGVYKDFIFCYDCLETLKASQWDTYVNDLKTDCQASLNRLILIGPPVNYRDFTIENGKEINSFLYQNNILSAKLKGSFEPQKRDEFWQDLKTYPVYEVLEKYF